MTTANEALLILKRWIQKETGLTVIYAEQAAPRPSAFPYVTLRLDSQLMIGGSDEVVSDGNGGNKTFSLRESSITANFYGKDSFEKIEKLKFHLDTEKTKRFLHYENGISLIDVTPIQNLTQLLETEWEERYQISFIIYYAHEEIEDVGYIEKIEINDKIVDVVNE